MKKELWNALQNSANDITIIGEYGDRINKILMLLFPRTAIVDFGGIGRMFLLTSKERKMKRYLQNYCIIQDEPYRLLIKRRG